MLDATSPIYPFAPTGLEATARTIQRQSDSVLEALLADPSNSNLLALHERLAKQLDEMSAKQRDVEIEREATFRQNNEEWTKQNQSNNVVSVEIARNNTLIAQSYHQHSFGTQAAWNAGNFQTQQVFAQNFPTVISAIGNHPELMSAFRPPLALN